LFKKIEQRSSRDGCDIKNNVFSLGKNYGFGKPAKKVERQHIYTQVNEIGVNKTVRDKPVHLPAAFHSGGVENQVIQDLRIGKGNYGDNAGDDNNDNGNRKIHQRKIKLESPNV
jgi:hypothetical protein